jgi:hypothetical protein
MLSQAGVALRVAQQAMRHSDIQLPMRNYTDPTLLDVAGAVAKLPTMGIEQEKLKVTGTNDTKTIDSSVAPTVAPALVFHSTFRPVLSQIGQSGD